MVNSSWGGSYSAAAGGADSLTLITANLPAHTHTGTTASDGAHTHGVTTTGADSGTNGFKPYGNVQSTLNTTSSGAHTHTFTTNSTGSGTAFDNRPAYATIVICEKD